MRRPCIRWLWDSHQAWLPWQSKGGFLIANGNRIMQCFVSGKLSKLRPLSSPWRVENIGWYFSTFHRSLTCNYFWVILINTSYILKCSSSGYAHRHDGSIGITFMEEIWSEFDREMNLKRSTVLRIKINGFIQSVDTWRVYSKPYVYKIWNIHHLYG